MTFRLSPILAGLAVLSAACGSTPPPAPKVEPPPVATTPPVEKPPPPPPKCESLDESCAAKEGTRARVADSGLSFEPPSGWLYAQEPELTVAKNDTAVVGVLVYDATDSKDAKKMAAARDTALGKLTKRLELTLPKAPIPWTVPQDAVKHDPFPLSMWERPGGTQGKKKGAVVVCTAKIEGTRMLLALGFVPDDAPNDAADAILKALKSIQTTKSP